MEEDVEMTEENKFVETYSADLGRLRDTVKDITRSFIINSNIQKNNYARLFTLNKMRDIMDTKKSKKTNFTKIKFAVNQEGMYESKENNDPPAPLIFKTYANQPKNRYKCFVNIGNDWVFMSQTIPDFFLIQNPELRINAIDDFK